MTARVTSIPTGSARDAEEALRALIIALARGAAEHDHAAMIASRPEPRK